MRRGRRASPQQRLVTAVFRSRSLGAILLVLIHIAIQPALGILVKPGRFVDDASLRRCLENLHAADSDKNDELSTDEYVAFINLESYGKIRGNAFADLPLNLVLVYYFIACLCSQDGRGQNCCVGDNAEIDISRKNGRPLYTQTFCSLAELGVYDALNPTPSPITTAMPSSTPSFFATPTYVPSPTPIFLHPSRKPSKPLPRPSGSPSLAPVSTTSPTGPPTAATPSPTTKFPTSSPSQQPASLSPTPLTLQPSTVPPTSTAPTVVPTAQAPPTRAPILVTSAPTPSPFAAPTSFPTMITVSPTLKPVIPPSPKPQTVTPTTLPPVAPPTLSPVTAKPTVRGLTCVSFEYGIANQAGLNAFDILNMVNNTLRTGLITATRNITIEILNATFPRKPSLGAGTQANTSAIIFQKFLLMLQPGSTVRHRNGGYQRSLGERSDLVQIAMENALADLYPTSNAKQLLQSQIEGMYQRNVLLDDAKVNPSRDRLSGLRVLHGSRRLVYFTDAVPVTINDIFDNPICPKNSTPPTLCAVVSTTVCVLLDVGENATAVDDLLLKGFQKAVDGGLLQAAIPPGNQV